VFSLRYGLDSWILFRWASALKGYTLWRNCTKKHSCRSKSVRYDLYFGARPCHDVCWTFWRSEVSCCLLPLPIKSVSLRWVAAFSGYTAILRSNTAERWEDVAKNLCQLYGVLLNNNILKKPKSASCIVKEKTMKSAGSLSGEDINR
jgi:hypothetical protein